MRHWNTLFGFCSSFFWNIYFFENMEHINFEHIIFWEIYRLLRNIMVSSLYNLILMSNVVRFTIGVSSDHHRSDYRRGKRQTHNASILLNYFITDTFLYAETKILSYFNILKLRSKANDPYTQYVEPLRLTGTALTHFR